MSSRIIIRGWRCAAAVVLLAACEHQPIAPSTPPASPISIPLEILKPVGPGPFPAVVVLHDCSGLGPRSSGSPRRWAKLLLDQGYVVAMPDSFSTRGFANGVCTEPNRDGVGPLRRARDAYEAFDHLRTLPYVDGKRIGAMGGSHGGSTTLATIASSVVARPAASRFRAGVALYPGCSMGSPSFRTRYQPSAPLLILAGELDDWTPAQPCRELARVAGDKVRVKVYPGAHHSFDSNAPLRYVTARVNSNSPTGRGATTGGNAEAWADSIRKVMEFFRRELGG